MDPQNNQIPQAPPTPVESATPAQTPPTPTDQTVVSSPPPIKKAPTKKLKWVLIIFALLLALLVPLGGFILLNQSENTPTPTPTIAPVPTEQVSACTLEVKLCPDGVTSVGRSGPNCEFEECPATSSAELPEETPTPSPTGTLE